MENTPLNKVKFFSQYWGQNIFVNPILDPRPVNNIYLFDYVEPEDIDDEYLELKSLSSITDEDAIGVINILKVELHSDSEIEFIHNAIKTYIDKGYKGIDSHILDYLRSKGYALPWMGLSIETLQEYGWIKLKTD